MVTIKSGASYFILHLLYLLQPQIKKKNIVCPSQALKEMYKTNCELSENKECRCGSVLIVDRDTLLKIWCHLKTSLSNTWE